MGRSHPELLHFKRLSSLIKDRRVLLTDFVPSKDLVGIYNLASVYIQPSLYEGFGIPVLEAFACGVPVVISKTQSLVEIAKSAALVADPTTPSDFAEKIKFLLNDTSKRLHLIRAGKTRIKDFSWKKAADETIDIYKKVLNGK
jgi:glycosyltransferase involved in cell wall biosynthesis